MFYLQFTLAATWFSVTICITIAILGGIADGMGSVVQICGSNVGGTLKLRACEFLGKWVSSVELEMLGKWFGWNRWIVVGSKLLGLSRIVQ